MSDSKPMSTSFMHVAEPNHNGGAYPSAPMRPRRVRRKKVRAHTKVDHGDSPVEGVPYCLHLPVGWDGVVP